ncbi:MAG: PQQ-binding-like beta-propeller repeat protein [Verrucomicrobia bacterium]|nr:PQQ-binding-like beta-propeller repeat protein [Verrucomicrobiota bacterium]
MWRTCILLPLAAGMVTAVTAENWPCWRGPRGDGSSLDARAPVHWSAASNVVWRTELPGTGHASPIVWNDRLFTVTAVPGLETRDLLCLDRRDGRMLWQQTVLTAPLEKKHTLNSFASSTPATDGQSIYVAFLDRDQMLAAAYDFDGRRRWLAHPGPFHSMHGFCSSPVLYQDLVLLNGDHDGDSYLVALDRQTGQTRWKTPRLHHTRSYCVPLIRPMAGHTQMVLSGDKCVASYDPANGRLRWIIDGPTEQFVASPVYSPSAGLVFITAGFPEHHILAIRPDGEGNVTRTHIAWRTTRGAGYVPSPLVIDKYLLVVSDAGVATCFEASTGRVFWAERLGEQHASLVAAAGRVYFLNDQGVMNVIQAGPAFAPIARNEIGEPCFASPAISDGDLFLRGDRSLFCVREIGARPATRGDGF